MRKSGASPISMRATAIAAAERRDRDARLEPAHQLLQHEYGAGDRRVERGGEARPCPGGEQHAAIGPVAPEHPADEVGDVRPHLHARALAAEREAGANSEHAAHELDADQSIGGVGKLAAQHRLDVGNAAAGGVRRELPNQPSGQRNRGGAGSRHKDKADDRGAMGPDDHHLAPVIRLQEREPEDGADQTGRGTHERRQQREHQQAAVSVG
jgi:hypothetical protein